MSLTAYAYLTVNHSTPAALSISPKTAAISTGTNETYTSTASDSYGNQWDATAQTVWLIDSDAAGYWTGNVYSSASAGVWQVTGFVGGLSDSASLTVNHGSALSITVSPASAALTAGQAQAFTAVAKDAGGNKWDVTNQTNWGIDTGAEGSWLGSTYTSAIQGNWLVIGTYNGLSSQASLTVNHAPATSITIGPASGSFTAGSTVAFTAAASDVYGNTWDVTSQTAWSIDAGAGGTLTSSSYTSELAGTWNVTGVFGSLAKSVYLTVNHAAPVGIQVNPYSASITAGSQEAYTTTAFDSYGNTWDVTSTAAYSITSGAQGSWAANVYAAAKAGVWNVTVAFEGFTATAPVTVSHGSAVSLALSPKNPSIQAGAAQVFTATASDTYGNVWDASATSVWIIDSGAGGAWTANNYTSASSGIWAVTAIFNGLTDKASLTVTHSALAGITVNPDSSAITAGSSQSFTATGSDSEDNSWDITSAVSWMASAGAGGSWSDNVYTSSNPGNWTVKASASGFSGTAWLAVSGFQPALQYSPVDFCQNGTVGFIDVVYFLDGYIQYYQNGAINPACDLNHDGKMDFQDIALFLLYYDAALQAAYGPAASPSPTPP